MPLTRWRFLAILGVSLSSFRAGRLWDASAATLSSLCIVHCIGLPLFTTLLPIASLFSEEEGLHLTMVLLAVPVTLWVVFVEVKTRRSTMFIAPALLGLALMLSAVFVGALSAYELHLTVVGGVTLAAAHLWRWTHHSSTHTHQGQES